MSENSKIEWTDATWNPITGCSVQSPGCKNCYAMKLAGTRLQHHKSRAGLTRPSAAGPVWTGETRFNAEWLEQPLQWSRARMIFVCAHGDLFHPSVPDEWIDQVFAVMALAGRHTFQVLTKQAKRAAEYFAHPVREALIGQQLGQINLKRTGSPVAEWSGLPLSNVWIGVSAEDQRRADDRIPALLQIPAAVRFLSLEPLLGPVNLDRIHEHGSAEGGGTWDSWESCITGRRFDTWSDGETSGWPKINWVIVGGESGPGARPMSIQWARELRDQCAAAGVPFFFKQWGEWAPARVYRSEEPGTFAFGDYQHDRERFVRTDHYPRAFTSFGARCILERVGKKAAGRLLDGREWNGVPSW